MNMKIIPLIFIAVLCLVCIPVVSATATDTTVIGIEWNQSNSSPSAIRYMDSDGNYISTPSSSFWDDHIIWGNIKRINVADNGTVLAVHGDPAFSYTGSNGQVMCVYPKFYYKAVQDGAYYRWWISPTTMTGYKIHPAFVSDGVTYNSTLSGAFEAAVYDVTATATEVDTIQVTAEPTSDGNLAITLDGNYAFTVAILNADTKEGVVDKIVAAGAKTDYQGVVWAVAKKDADELTYTAGSSGLKSTVLMPTACGVTSTITKTTSGAGGYVKNDAAGVSFTSTTGDKMASIAGVKPLSGWQKATATKPNMRVLAQNRGTGWNLQNYNQVSAIELLFLFEYGSFNAQSKIGAGVTGVNDAIAGNTYNNALNTGFTAGVGASSTDFGNASGACTGVTHYKTGGAANPVSFRGIENLWGNVWKWVDGINIKADRNPWIADHDFADDTFAHPYSDTGLTLHNANGYPTNITFAAAMDYGFLASAVGGSDATYLCDYYYQSTGNRAALMGGGWADGANAGPFSWSLYNAASIVYRSFGARLAYIGDVNTSPLITCNFTSNTTTVQTDETIQFTDTSSSSTTLSSWNWSFGDGTYSGSQNPEKAYTVTGYYNVSLTVTDVYGGTAAITKTDYITVCNPLSANFTGTPTSGSTPLTVQFTDESIGPTTWDWSFGDGTPNSTTQSPAHTYTTSGVYDVILTVGNGVIIDTLEKAAYITAGNVTPTPTPTPTPTVTPTGTIPIQQPVETGKLSPFAFVVLATVNAGLWLYTFIDNENRNYYYIYTAIACTILSFLLAMFLLNGFISESFVVTASETTINTSVYSTHMVNHVPITDVSFAYLFGFIGCVMMVITVLAVIEAIREISEGY